MPLNMILTILPIAVIVVLVLLLLFMGYLKAPPDTAYIISGLGRKRILIGKAGWRVPFFERVDKLSLRIMQVDVKTSEAVPTNEFINVTVDGVANVKISSDPELLKLAAEALLGKRPEELVGLVTQVTVVVTWMKISKARMSRSTYATKQQPYEVQPGSRRLCWSCAPLRLLTSRLESQDEILV